MSDTDIQNPQFAHAPVGAANAIFNTHAEQLRAWREQHPEVSAIDQAFNGAVQDAWKMLLQEVWNAADQESSKREAVDRFSKAVNVAKEARSLALKCFTEEDIERSRKTFPDVMAALAKK